VDFAISAGLIRVPIRNVVVIQLGFYVASRDADVVWCAEFPLDSGALGQILKAAAAMDCQSVSLRG
jgi:hypothetical protein